jgi:hypothetical protein
MILKEAEVFDHLCMVANPIHDVDLREILQALTWEIRALEAPGYPLLSGAAAKTVAAVAAGWIDMVGKASVATDVFETNLVGCSHLLQLIKILIPIGLVFGAGPAIEAADPNQFIS